MSQNDLSIANQGFASFRSDLNSALQALGSTNSGTSAPSTTYANQLFYDTTNNILKIRNEDNDAFINLITLDQTNDKAKFDLDGTELILDADGDTSITSDTDDRVDIKVAGSDVVHVNSSGIGIKTTSGSSFTQNASSDLVIGAGSGNSGMTLFSGTSSQGAISFADGTASDNTQYRGFINYAHNLDALLFGVSGAEKVRIDASGRLLLGTSTSFADGNSEDLQISSSGDTGIMIKSGTSNFGSIHFGDATSGSARNRGVVRYNHTDDALELFTAESQRMTIDNSGKVFVSKTSASRTTVGHELHADGFTRHTVSGDKVLELIRTTSDGEILEFFKDTSLVGQINSKDGELAIGTINTGFRFVDGSNAISPHSLQSNSGRDNAIALGSSGARFDDAFITNGVTTGSDQNEKQDIASATNKELKVASKLSALFKTYKWKDAVEQKGDKARTHTGIIAQEVQSAFSAEGLDASNYGMFMSDTWTNEDGKEQTRLGVRYPELFSFIFSSIEARLTALEAK